MHRTIWDSFERWRGTGPSYARGLIAGAPRGMCEPGMSATASSRHERRACFNPDRALGTQLSIRLHGRPLNSSPATTALVYCSSRTTGRSQWTRLHGGDEAIEALLSEIYMQ